LLWVRHSNEDLNRKAQRCRHQGEGDERQKLVLATEPPRVTICELSKLRGADEGDNRHTSRQPFAPSLVN
jgi:hypothetical protein